MADARLPVPSGNDSVRLGRRAIDLHDQGRSGHRSVGAVEHLRDERLGECFPHAAALAVALEHDDGRGIAIARQDEVVPAAADSGSQNREGTSGQES